MLQNGDNDVLEDPSIVAISSRDLNKKKGADEDITSGMVKLSLKKNIGTRRIKTYLGHLSVPFLLIVFFFVFLFFVFDKINILQTNILWGPGK